ncbi:MAG: lactate utilization protein [Sulfurospirillum sp.]|nr:lactate utilization protein [Sulfurospirillum sp.]
MFENFKQRAELSGNTEVKRFETTPSALQFIEDLLVQEDIKEEAGSYALWAQSPILSSFDADSMASRHPGLYFKVDRELAKNARIGITQLEWGLAETGSMAQDSTNIEQRLASALSWIHVAILPTTKIIADIPALMGKMHPKNNKYITLITGASKTADIERVLAIGVHGPERLIIVCVDDLQS